MTNKQTERDLLNAVNAVGDAVRGGQPDKPAVIAYETLTIANSAIALTASFPGDAESFVGVLETGQVRKRAGGTDPTASEGTLVEIGAVIVLSADDIVNMRFIRTGTISGVLKGHYYNVPVSAILGAIQSGGASLVQGTVANDAVDADNPVKIGFKAESGTPDSVADGDRVDAYGDVKGRLAVFIGEKGSSRDAKVVPAGDADSATLSSLVVFSMGAVMGPDGTMNRNRGAGDTASSIGVQLVSPTGHDHNSVAGDEQILAAAGKLHNVNVHDVTTGGVITIYDATTETGTVIAVLTLVAGESFFTIPFDVACATGLFIGYDGTVVADLTVSTAI